MRITVITPVFAVAGVPLAQMRFARALSAEGFDVELVFGRIDVSRYGPIEIPGVKVVNLGAERVRSMFRPLLTYIRRRRPEVIFSAEDHLNIMVLTALIASGSRAKFSGSSRVTPFDTYSERLLTKRWFLKQAARAVMWRADALTCVSKDMVDQYRKVFRSPPHVPVYNIIDHENSRTAFDEAVDHDWFVRKEVPVIVAAGTLAPWKGFDDLIDAVALVTTRRPVRLVILGEGAMRDHLQVKIDMSGLGASVQLLGRTANPLKYFARADVFVLSSHVEGMPNVLVEAMLCGCTPVATDCPTGPRELLQNDRYGYLVPMRNPPAMARAIERALDNPISPQELAEAVKPFQATTVIEQHFSALGLIGDLLRQRELQALKNHKSSLRGQTK